MMIIIIGNNITLKIKRMFQSSVCLFCRGAAAAAGSAGAELRSFFLPFFPWAWTLTLSVQDLGLLNVGVSEIADPSIVPYIVTK